MPLPDGELEFMFVGIPARDGTVVEPPVREGWTVGAAWTQPFGVAFILVKEEP